MLSLLLGRMNGFASELLTLLARLLGRLAEDPGRSSLVAGTPNEILLETSGCSLSRCEVLEMLLGRLRPVRTVTDDGTLTSKPFARGEFLMALVRGEFLGVDPFDVDGGSLDLTECTRSSIFCIRPIRPLIWYSELDLGRDSDCAVVGLGRGGPIRPVAVIAGVTPTDKEGPLECRGNLVEALAGRGVVPASGSSDLLIVGSGVLGTAFPAVAAVSDSGGEGGVGTSLPDDSDFVAGGVETLGEGGVTIETSEVGDLGLAGFA